MILPIINQNHDIASTFKYQGTSNKSLKSPISRCALIIH
ncbi:hypothetical protein SynA1562_00135 [Synechococcus sp. A15-62]|nr:hypothetical protein SynA1562_00135 [Synechococcus sp. A15-62]